MKNSGMLAVPPTRLLLHAGGSGILVLGTMLIVGCSGRGQASLEKKPRPVQVATLRTQPPPDASLVAASVASWKTEEIGFEVAGRVEWVIEPNEEIEGRIESSEGELLLEGTPVARIESERYRLQVETAKADVARATQNVRSTEIQLNKSVPSRIRAAEAELKLALTDLDRSKKLMRQNAGSQSDLDRDQAKYDTALASQEELEATLKATEADLQSAESQLLQAEQSLRNAERDLKDCTLYSSFRGQIADVAVVPGSVVSVGQAVATVQMMDPIKVEIEVSAADSRRLQGRERLPVMVTEPDGVVREHDGFLYLIDPVADSATRTYTVTLLLLNQKQASSDADSVALATTDQTWRLDFKFLPGAEKGMLFAPESAMLQDDQGHYLWMIENVDTHQPIPTDRLLKVRKLRVTLGEARFPFLGNWVFQQVMIDDPDFNPAENVVTGKLLFTNSDGSPGDPAKWDGNTVMLDHGGQWTLRPGDLVKVNLSDVDSKPGYFVPMDALIRRDGKTHLMTIAGEGDKSTVSLMEINLVSPDGGSTTSSLRKIESANGEPLDGLQYVTKGAHYLRDGETVLAITSTGDES